tara:strand:+ start:2064 stop:2390 length:327 start_codon:yes stop_codon:yes gene_type:complete
MDLDQDTLAGIIGWTGATILVYTYLRHLRKSIESQYSAMQLHHVLEDRISKINPYEEQEKYRELNSLRCEIEEKYNKGKISPKDVKNIRTALDKYKLWETSKKTKLTT